ncbi:MAG: glycosyltransferase, partial [Okeania sp. SIO2H7]|nr:glycosyltransferase [Okeania sp. SIO2H7]
MVIFCLFGIHRLWHLWTYFRIQYKDKKNPLKDQTSDSVSSLLTLNSGHNFIPPDQLAVATVTVFPPVTIQLPIYNEKYVVERLVNAVCAIDYPRDSLEIQVLDDSTDETIEKVDELVQQKQEQGFDIKAIRRPCRQGFK